MGIAMTFPRHTTDSAPQAAREALVAAERSMGFIPNLYAHLAEAPAVLDAYLGLSKQFDLTSLSPAERQVVLLAASVENGCEFCVEAHSMLASGPARVPTDVVESLRSRQAPPDDRLAALANFTREVVRERGSVHGEATERLLQTGYTPQQALEVVLGVAMKTLSSYANHLTGTEANAEFARFAWHQESVGNGPGPQGITGQRMQETRQ